MNAAFPRSALVRSPRRMVLMLAAALVLSACATQEGPYKEQQERLPPLTASDGRIVIYRGASLAWAVLPNVYLNGIVVGAAVTNTAYLLDLPKGSYEITVTTEVEKKVRFPLETGEVKYVRLTHAFGLVTDRIVPELVAADDATGELRGLKPVPATAYRAANQAMRALGVTGVGVRAFSPPAFFNSSCRVAGYLQAPDKLSHTQYIQKAFEEVLRAEGAYAQGPARVTIGGSVRALDFSSTSGYWQIDLALDSSNGSKLEVSEHYEFYGGYGALQACMNTADAYVRAVQSLVNKVFRSSDFAALLR